METMKLPHYIIDTIERRWAARLEEDARLWKQKRGLSTASSVHRSSWEVGVQASVLLKPRGRMRGKA
jgi:hypothetical protein